MAPADAEDEARVSVTAVCVLANVEQPLPEAANEWVAELAKEAESRGGVIVVPPKRANPRRWEFTIVRFADRHAAVIDAIEMRNRGVRVAVVGIATRMAAADDRIAVDRAMREAVTAARTMAATAQGGEIVLDALTYEPLARLLVVKKRGEGDGFNLEEKLNYPVGWRQARHTSRSLRPTFDTALAVVGATAGLVAWVALVGGLTMWARFRAAGVPASDAISLLPRQLLVTEGVRALVVPLLAGLGAASLAFGVERLAGEQATNARMWTRDHVPAWLRRVLLSRVRLRRVLVGIAVAATVVWLVSVLLAINWWSAVVLVGVSLGALSGVLWLLARDWRGRRVFAVLSVFSVAALWAGVAVFLYEWGAKAPRLQTARIELQAGGAEWGLYVAETGDTVLLAQGNAGGQHCGLRLVPSDTVRAISIGAAAATGFSSPKQCLPLPTKKATNPPKKPGSNKTTTETVTKTVVGTVPVTTIENTTVMLTTVVTTSTTTSPPDAVIPVTDVVLPSRLQIARVRFQPDPLRSRHQRVAVTIWIEDTEHHLVKGAEVFVLTTQYGRFLPATTKTHSCANGRAYAALRPAAHPRVGRGGRVVLLIRAHKPGEPRLAGVSARRLVSFHTSGRSETRTGTQPPIHHC